MEEALQMIFKSLEDIRHTSRKLLVMSRMFESVGNSKIADELYNISNQIYADQSAILMNLDDVIKN